MIGCYVSRRVSLLRSNKQQQPTMSAGPWKKRRSAQDRIAIARSKRGRNVTTVCSGAHSGDHLDLASSSSLDISETTSDVDTSETIDHTSQSSTVSSPCTDLPQQLTDEQILDKLDNWVQDIGREDNMMLTLLLYETFQKEFGLGKLEAAVKVSRIVHHHERSIRRWRDSSRQHGDIPSLKVGQYERQTLADDEEVRRKATAWAREHSNVKGQPNMTIQDFCQYLNNDLLPSLSFLRGLPNKVSLETARKFLHNLGFERVDTGKKGVYIDGQERPDVVQERAIFLQKFTDLECNHLPPPCPSDVSPEVTELTDSGNPASSKHLVIICHDESAFQSNEDQTFS